VKTFSDGGGGSGRCRCGAQDVAGQTRGRDDGEGGGGGRAGVRIEKFRRDGFVEWLARFASFAVNYTV